MDDREKRTLVALAKMAGQYLCRGDILDSGDMDAGETAILILAEHGFVEVDERGRIKRVGRQPEAKLFVDAWSEL
jgi:hypothetical protein